MDYQKSLKKFLSKTAEVSYQGGLKLSNMDLSLESDDWNPILSRLVRHKAGHPPLERAMSKIGSKIVPLLQDKLAELKGIKIAPILRILGAILGEEGKELFLRYAQKSGLVRDTSLMLLAQYCPLEATDLVLRASQSNQSVEILYALLFLRSEEGYLRAQQLCKGKDGPFEISGDTLTVEVLKNISNLAIKQIKSKQLPLPRWPFESVLISSAIVGKLPRNLSDEYLIALTNYPVGWVKRDAAIKLAIHEHEIGLKIIQDNCLNDIFYAKAAIAHCARLKTGCYFDWFSQKLIVVPPTPTLLAHDQPYGYIINYLCSVAKDEERWTTLLNEHKSSKYFYLNPLRDALKSGQTLLSSKDLSEQLKGLEKLAAEKSPEIISWIKRRLMQEKALSRDEYFSILESLRLLGDPNTISLLSSVIDRFQPDGFAKDFAKEVTKSLE